MTFGEQITIEGLERDPYPIYARLRDEEPVAWVPAVQLWLVTRYEDVRTVDLSPEVFTAATDPSTLNRTMGVNMLGSEGPDQQRIRRVVEPPFRPRDVEERTKGMIPPIVQCLVRAIIVGLWVIQSLPKSCHLKSILDASKSPRGTFANRRDDLRPFPKGKTGAARSELADLILLAVRPPRPLSRYAIVVLRNFTASLLEQVQVFPIPGGIPK